MSQIRYKKPSWQQFRQTQDEVAQVLVTHHAGKILTAILKALPPAQFEQIAKQFGYEAEV